MPEDNEGISLLPALRGEAFSGREAVFAEWEDLIYSVSDGEWKYIHNPRGVRPRKPPYHLVPGVGFPYQCFELYKVNEDPGEQNNRYGQDEAPLKALRHLLKTFLNDPAHRQPMVLPDQQDPGLSALGYIGSTKERDLVEIPCGDQK